MAQPEQFPYMLTDPALGEASLLPFMPITRGIRWSGPCTFFGVPRLAIGMGSDRLCSVFARRYANF